MHERRWKTGGERWTVQTSRRIVEYGRRAL